MNKIIVMLLTAFLITFASCSKKTEVSNPLLGNPSDKMSGRIATVTNNMQTKYGTFTGAASVQGVFKSDLNISSFKIGDYDIEKKPTGMFFNSTTSDKNFEQKFMSFYGNPLEIALNGTLLKKMPAVPYANVVTLKYELENWKISKSKGLTLTWKIRNQTNNQNNVTTNGVSVGVLGFDPIDLSAQVPGSVTVVAIVPGNLQNTTGKSKYWIVNGYANTFTIDPSALSNFAVGETLDIMIGTGTNTTHYQNGNPIDILSLNSTNLPGVEIIH